MYYPSIQTNSLGPGFSALLMNPLLDVYEQEHGWKSELQEHDRDFSVEEDFGCGGRLGKLIPNHPFPISEQIWPM